MTVEGEYFEEEIQSLSLDCYDEFGVLSSLFQGQANKESGFGENVFYNNYMGIKCHDSTAYDGCRIGKTGEVIDGSYVGNLMLAFQCYNNYEECMIDYGTRLHLPRYENVLKSDNYWDASYWLIKGGYATGLTYLSSLRRQYIEPRELYLWDGFVKGDRLSNNDNLYAQIYSNDSLWAIKNYPLTANFKYGEFWQKDGKEPSKLLFNNIVWMANQLQKLRDYINSFYNVVNIYKIIVNSCIRDVWYNRKQKGVEGSNHLMGLAVDIKCTKLTLNELLYFAMRTTDFKEFGIYRKRGFLHLGFGLLKPLHIWEG